MIMLAIRGVWKQVKLDTGAQYCVADTKWKSFDRKLNVPAPTMSIDALIVEHDTEDFMIGEQWMYDNGVNIDSVSGEMKLYSDEIKMVMPVKGVGSYEQRTIRTAKVRLSREAIVRTQSVRNVEVAVPAPEVSVGLFEPNVRKGAHVMVAPTIFTVQGGKTTVPKLNLVGRMTKLPSREALDEIDLNTSPLSNEEELEIGDMCPDDKVLLVKLLRIYPSLLKPKTGCPPATTLGVAHHINTGSEPPIKMRPRRHSRAENETIEVKQMLRNGVIEEGTGAWEFPVVPVKK
ncbi:unnamed protein product [Phytophthora fragariaefolia]|uniref:Unnamed protein product n=1 Tax=Phytophthora fragariaefolia TaxID=1490495 RepID=A0A9W7D3W8_9STRA|nr:unnamed protein product [Phytophthora fragariaefolia]